MVATELANMASLHTCIHAAADGRTEGTAKDALVSLRLSMCACCLAPGNAAGHTRSPSPTTERAVRADQASAPEGQRVSPARRKQRAVIPELDCRAKTQIARRD